MRSRSRKYIFNTLSCCTCTWKTAGAATLVGWLRGNRTRSVQRMLLSNWIAYCTTSWRGVPPSIRPPSRCICFPPSRSTPPSLDALCKKRPSGAALLLLCPASSRQQLPQQRRSDLRGNRCVCTRCLFLPANKLQRLKRIKS